MKMFPQQSEEFKVNGFFIWLENDQWGGPYLWIENEENWKRNIAFPIKDGFSLEWFEVSEEHWVHLLPETVKEFCVRLVKNSAFL